MNKFISKNNFLFQLSILILILFGLYIRSIDLWRHVDGTIRDPWRESDIASIARNYYYEDMNFLHPRIDWRGNTPGIAEMEFPIFPWLIAVSYKLFGFNEYFGRIISYLFSIFSIFIFFNFASSKLSHSGVLAALLFFALSPLSVRISNSLQSDGLMFFFYISSVYYFDKWLNENSPKSYWLSLISTALTILTKASAAHIGLLFAVLTLKKYGKRAFFDQKIIFFAVFALLPSLIWYTYAHHFWLTYKLSLGISNETHWIGLNFKDYPTLLYHIFNIEIRYVIFPAGFIFILSSLIYCRNKVPALIGYWLFSIFVFYIVTARTSGDSWAIYYHVIAVPPIALLIGNQVDAINKKIDFVLFSKLVILTAIFGALIVIVNYHLQIFDISRSLKYISVVLIPAATISFFVTCTYKNVCYPDKITFLKQYIGLIFFLSLFFVFTTHQAFRCGFSFHPREARNLYACAKLFKPLLSNDTLILVSGGPCVDEFGKPVAYNASYFFYWTEHKGFNICADNITIKNIHKYYSKGAKYFILEKTNTNKNLKLISELSNEFAVLIDCKDAILFKLG